MAENERTPVVSESVRVELTALVLPLIAWMKKHGGPYALLTVTAERAELSEALVGIVPLKSGDEKEPIDG